MNHPTGQDYSRIDETDEDRFEERIERVRKECSMPRQIAPDCFQLMDGLEIKFGSDGTWLAFKDHSGNSSVIRLENLPDSSGRIFNTTIQEWSKDRRAACVSCSQCGKVFAPGVDATKCDHKPYRPDGTKRDAL